MISRVLYALEMALAYIKRHTELRFAFVLIIILPLAFLYTSNQFLEAGRVNQDKLQRDRIGLLHDAFISILRASEYNATVVQQEILDISSLNPDITKFRVIEQTGQDFMVIAALDETLIGQPEPATGTYQSAAVRFDESLIFPLQINGERHWQAVRSTATEQGTYFVLTENSFASVDTYLRNAETKAYAVLAFIYIFLLALTYWLVRLTNYQSLYSKAQMAIKTKDMFTNMIAHELRAPLSAMRGYASMIAEKSKDAEAVSTYSRRIGLSAERLLTIVDDLLDVARIQSGQLKVEKTATNLTQIVLEVSEELAPSASEKNIQLLTTGVGAEHFVQTDPKRLHQALTNLVSNAIKYTPAGSIEVSLEEKHKTIELRVKDTGLGISAEDQKQLFAPFFRVDSGDVSAITGTGLGMWITRQLIELMDGTIGVESIKDVGTQVVVTIPRVKTVGGVIS